MTTQLSPHTSTYLQDGGSQLDFILLDGSGSMSGPWFDMMAGLETYVSTLKAASVRSHIILDVFSDGWRDGINTLIIDRQRDAPLSEWLPTRQSPLTASWGGTPLYDAINHSVRALRDLAPERCAFTCITDGFDEKSVFTSVDQARALLDWCRAHGWQVNFIGCNFNNTRMARLLGSERAAIGIATTHIPDAMRALADKRIRYGQTGDDMEWSDGERKQFGGLLTHQGSAA